MSPPPSIVTVKMGIAYYRSEGCRGNVPLMLREGRALGAAGIPGRPDGEEGTSAHSPMQVEDLDIHGEKRTGILRTRLKKSCEFQAGIKRNLPG